MEGAGGKSKIPLSVQVVIPAATRTLARFAAGRAALLIFLRVLRQLHNSQPFIAQFALAARLVCARHKIGYLLGPYQPALHALRP